MVVNGLYKIDIKYYHDFPNENHIQLKSGRPFYYAIQDNRGVFWLVPLSTQVANYKDKISKVEQKRGKGKCLIYHIGIVTGQEMVFRICDMIPVTEEYIAGEFVKYGKHYVIQQESLIKELTRKSRDYIKQLEIGRMHSRMGGVSIREKLLELINGSKCGEGKNKGEK